MVWYSRQLSSRCLIELSKSTGFTRQFTGTVKLSSAGSSFKVGIIGAGPAGFYTAQHLLKHLPGVEIDLYQKLPVPFGLIRYGVAPDHPEVKNTAHKFNALLESPKIQYIGNVPIGQTESPISWNQLIQNYHGMVISTGAPDDKNMGIPDEDQFPQSLISARAFVGWYNGHPDWKNLNPNLDVSSAVIVGQGNVALDAARILLTPPEDLRKTDIAAHALQSLNKSKISRVDLVGRRGPIQVAFTSKELREMFELIDTRLDVDIDMLESEIDKNYDFLSKNRQKKRLMDVLLKGARRDSGKTTSKTWGLKFLLSPIRVESDSNRILSSVIFRKNEIQGVGDSAKSIGTNDLIKIDCPLLMRSIGYKTSPLITNGISIRDTGHGLLHERGRVLQDDSNIAIPGLYTSGWAKRGPTGVIAATMYDAIETADSIIEDYNNNAKFLNGSRREELKAGFQNIMPILNSQNYQWINKKGWFAIEEYERASASGERFYEKITDVTEMLRIASLSPIQ